MTAPAAGPAPALFTLRVGEFEGPLDLLLHLCRTQEIDLARLPVRAITDQYLAHLEAMDFRDLDTAGAYLVMAATLIYLKSRLLVGSGEDAEPLDEEGEALRHELEARLRAYARVKALGGWLAAREAEQALLWGRPAGELPSADEISLEDLSVHLLVEALRGLRARQAPEALQEVTAEPVSVLERMAEILAVLRDTWSLLFSSLTGERHRREVVVTLLAVLELVRLGHVRVQQLEPFGEIVVERRAEPAPAPMPAAATDAEAGHA